MNDETLKALETNDDTPKEEELTVEILDDKTDSTNKKDNTQEENKRDTQNIKPKKQRKPINLSKVVIWTVGILYVITQLIMLAKDTKPVDGDISYKQVFEMLDNDEVESIAIVKDSDTYKVRTKDGHSYSAVNPKSDGFVEELMKHGAEISVAKESRVTAVSGFLIGLPLILILIMFATYLTTTIVGGNTKMFTLLKRDKNEVSFKDVKGLSEEKEELHFAVDQLRNWKKLQDLGARPCKGILLYGPPGTGKTRLAKAIAHEAGVPFISASGSDFSEVFVGVGAARVRTLFTLAAENAPCIIFIDEIDCLGKRRKGGDGASQDHNQTLNAMLQRMDGLNKVNGILVIGATNRRDDLDSALLRPGRFDRHYYIGAPKTKHDRDEMVEYYLSDKKLYKGVTVETVSKLCVGLTGAEIEAVMNEAVYISLREGREGHINLADIDESIMKQHTSGVKQEHTSKRDLQITAVHEAGHTIVSLALGIPISKVSIIPYSNGMGGHTAKDLDANELKQLQFKSENEKDIMMLLAGMVSEDIVYGEHTQGPSSDLDRATKLVYAMFVQDGQGGSLLNETSLMQEGVMHEVSEARRKELDEALSKYRECTEKILKDNWSLHNKLAARLLEEKTIVMPTLQSIAEYPDAEIIPLKG